MYIESDFPNQHIIAGKGGKKLGNLEYYRLRKAGLILLSFLYSTVEKSDLEERAANLVKMLQYWAARMKVSKMKLIPVQKPSLPARGEIQLHPEFTNKKVKMQQNRFNPGVHE
ncbi:hypothetical protein Y1Q_0009831 [Alligator mississippiensis]|uniref:Uncharacterized protein n=1 Tax=Alligator mississippiensis TaxID=8496 RepID=A0A151MX41_ALLMI|nr:hypothetical protein Y1Q_0009831 [Alligator mississippiensis]